MDREAFESMVAEAIESLPPAFAQHMANVAVIVADQPTREQRRRLRLHPWQSLYGLYEGVPLTERSSIGMLPPDVITIFQEPLERDFGADELAAQVRRTLLHEVAHLFGISDERLHELDAY